MPTRRHSPAARVIDPTHLPPELEARIAALERAEPRPDFDAASWVWMVLLGLALPVALLILGWRL